MLIPRWGRTESHQTGLLGTHPRPGESTGLFWASPKSVPIRYSLGQDITLQQWSYPGVTSHRFDKHYPGIETVPKSKKLKASVFPCRRMTGRSMLVGFTAGPNRFCVSVAVDKGLVMLGHQRRGRARLKTISIGDGSTFRRWGGESIVWALESPLREEAVWRGLCGSSHRRRPQTGKEMAKALLLSKAHVVGIGG